ncbi:DUF4139 domain-containing protein [Aureibacter tunicatorum]|uniref:Mucoidy inhibitor MuiA family protein n=1 Tax=Aureibacter tunicatorum TaxID=866807 RepID=A0AAE3XLQ0_9BACT|nr:mucoidy inhibitor MuiA family protein [Aureibacter tunicatorum]MDR6238878.1 hypothetical protein [Aureibacter tunicatorum]BDD05195.1 hypothetical protein AUTU_26780 [Aureibacter tunicatorum]
MKSLSLFFLGIILFFGLGVQAQKVPEKKVVTKVNDVTVFLEGAQIERKKTVYIPKGETILKFTGLSPYVDAKSVQVKAQGRVMVLSVHFQKEVLGIKSMSKELDDLEKQLEEVDKKLLLERTHLDIISEELKFLIENRHVGGKSEQVSVSNLQLASEFYGKKLTSLKMKEIERKSVIDKLKKDEKAINDKIDELIDQKVYPEGEVIVKVDAELSGDFPIALSYLVKNASWYPTYDIRAKNIEEPVEVVYKANVKQDTKVDWENVKLKFSSATPNQSSIAPELSTYFLGYRSRPPVYKKRTGNQITGQVTEASGEGAIGVNVVVEGSTIKTETDFSGNYSLTVPDNADYLVFSGIGYKSQTVRCDRNVIDVDIEADVRELDEVVVTAFGIDRNRPSRKLRGKVAGVKLESKPEVKIRGAASLSIPLEQKENQTTVDFTIDKPYSVKSDNKSFAVDMAHYELPAEYQYYAVPKIDKSAFLIANVIDWEKYNFLEGEANVFFEGTYIGKTIMDTRYASDTLEISLGSDKQVSVNREKMVDFTTKKFIGTKKEESRAWKTTVKNNKAQAINMMILDQVPVSVLEEIEVKVLKDSGAKRNVENGEIKWVFDLKPKASKELELKYAVKYPKQKKLIIE